MDGSSPKRPGHPALQYLDTLHARMPREDFDVMLRMLRATIAAIGSREAGTIHYDLCEADEARVTPALRDEVATVVMIALTGRMDQNFVHRDAGDDSTQIRAMVDRATAEDPDRIDELRRVVDEREELERELRGIARASGLEEDI
ncbi:hypothetical protein ABZW18_26950 [Streptomyces sp. NPDC004647]|uniref:hypothetical protein n=1 Tax=Streptomyces sp. NPDC004647 TaxID=3154671 RepID=UPI0033B98D3F